MLPPHGVWVTEASPAAVHGRQHHMVAPHGERLPYHKTNRLLLGPCIGIARVDVQ